MRSKATLSLPLLLATTMLYGACGAPSYQFRTESGARCFAPCKATYRSCKLHCSDYSTLDQRSRPRRHDGVLLLLEVAGDVACVGICRNILKRCAADCGAIGVAKAPRRPSADLDVRKRQLHIKRMKMEGKWQRIQSRCAALDADVRKRFAAGHPGKTSHCPTSATFRRSCSDLTLNAVNCLFSDIAKTQRHACRAAFSKADSDYVQGMFDMMSNCLSPRYQPMTTPASSQPVVQQQSDDETPPK